MQKNTGSQHSKVSKTSDGKIMLLSKYAECAIAKTKIYQRARGKQVIRLIRNQNSFEQDTIYEYNFEVYKN